MGHGPSEVWRPPGMMDEELGTRRAFRLARRARWRRAWVLRTRFPHCVAATGTSGIDQRTRYFTESCVCIGEGPLQFTTTELAVCPLSTSRGYRSSLPRTTTAVIVPSQIPRNSYAGPMMPWQHPNRLPATARAHMPPFGVLGLRPGCGHIRLMPPNEPRYPHAMVPRLHHDPSPAPAGAHVPLGVFRRRPVW
jgi:hypothetical protein